VENIVEFKAKSNQINWDTTIAVVVFHVFAVWALFTFSWANLAAFIITWWIAGSLGVGLGYHRQLTHRGFKTPRWLEYFFAFCGNLALQSGAVKWVTTHRIHHAFTETDKDPHSPRNGTYWAHIGWIIRGTSQEHDEATIKKYSPDLIKDPIHVFLSKYYWVTPILVGAILFAIGGWSMVLWGIFARTVFGWHMTWLVNSATHMWGTRRFETRDDSTNNALIAAVTFGEGWHNNHHAQPASAKHGLAWYEFDINWVTIRFLEKIGLATDVRVYKLGEQPTQLKRAA
jgi:sn-1 stearoyl-lipid 9-desaturase